jgi:DNA-binding protein HU-beta
LSLAGFGVHAPGFSHRAAQKRPGLPLRPGAALLTGAGHFHRFSAGGVDFYFKFGYSAAEDRGEERFSTKKFKQGDDRMSKAMTKGQIVAGVAEKVGITKKQAGEAIEMLATMAYKNAKNGFTVPGLGKLVLVNRKARMGRNPATGEAIKIPAKRVVKFRVAKACKDAILG